MQNLNLLPRWKSWAVNAGAWSGKAMPALPAHLRNISDTQERGGVEKKEGTRGKRRVGKEPGLQIWRDWKMAHYLQTKLPDLGLGTSEDHLSPVGEGGIWLEGTGGAWKEAVYLGFAGVLPGPLKLQPEIGGVGAALEGVQLDPEDALHLQPLPLHPRLRFCLHHEPFLSRGITPRQEHGCSSLP